MVVGIVHAGLAPIIVVSDVRPNLILVAAVLVGVAFGFRTATLWAFVGGLTANLLGPQPLGTISLPLLMVVAMVEGGRRLFGRLTWVYPVVAAFAASVVFDAATIGLLELMGEPMGIGVPFNRILPAAALNAALAGVCMYPVYLVARRVLPEEAAW